MLLNELYAGRIVWDKVPMVKDPTTGKRISRDNAKGQHRITEAAQLRIIERRRLAREAGDQTKPGCSRQSGLRPVFHSRNASICY
jgi:hypothetical protein